MQLKDAEVEWMVAVLHKLGQTLGRRGTFLAASYLFESALDASLSVLLTTKRKVNNTISCSTCIRSGGREIKNQVISFN